MKYKEGQTQFLHFLKCKGFKSPTHYYCNKNSKKNMGHPPKSICYTKIQSFSSNHWIKIKFDS